MLQNSRKVFQDYADAWNRHDAGAIVAAFAEGGTYTDPTTRGPLTGAAIGAFAESLWAAFPDLSFETLSSIESGDDLLSAEWLMTGTNTGSMNGLSPTGKTISLQGADFVRLEGGKIRSVQGYFDPGVVPRSLGLDIIVQPPALGPFEFGTSVRVSSGNKALPGAYSITLIETRSQEERLAVRESAGKIGQEMLSIPGFIAFLGASVGARMVTITAWESSDSMAPLMKGGEHRDVVRRFFAGELGRGASTGIWIPGRLNPRRIRCEVCSKMSPVSAPGDKCSCGATLADPLAYW